MFRMPNSNTWKVIDYHWIREQVRHLIKKTK